MRDLCLILGSTKSVFENQIIYESIYIVFILPRNWSSFILKPRIYRGKRGLPEGLINGLETYALTFRKRDNSFLLIIAVSYLKFD